MHKNIIIPLLCQCEWFLLTCVSKNSIVSKDMIFYLLWHNVLLWNSHIYKKSSFLSFYSFLFLVNNTGKWQSKIARVWQKWMGWKMPLCKLHIFWMAPCLICYFIVLLFYIEWKWLLLRNLTHNVNHSLSI